MKGCFCRGLGVALGPFKFRADTPFRVLGFLGFRPASMLQSLRRVPTQRCSWRLAARGLFKKARGDRMYAVETDRRRFGHSSKLLAYFARAQVFSPPSAKLAAFAPQTVNKPGLSSKSGVGCGCPGLRKIGLLAMPNSSFFRCLCLQPNC